MHITHHGKLSEEPTLRLGFIGCGSHSFRNLYATLQFLPVTLEAVCDLELEKAKVFARKFGASRAYDDYQKMLTEGGIDAVMIVTNYDDMGRPRYPEIAANCLKAGVHVWMEKPPAASVSDLQMLKTLADERNLHVVTGLKKMFFPVNVKAKELMTQADFGKVQLVTITYPQSIPTVEELQTYIHRKQKVNSVIWFLDHLCHPAALMVYLLGMPKTLSYERSEDGAGAATFTFDNGAVAVLAMTHGSSSNCGMENTMIIGQHGRRIVIDNNIRLRYDRNPPYEPGTSYGSAPNFYTGTINETSAIWEPEFSLGQLYNKGVFIQGFYNEINALVRAVLDDESLTQGTLEYAMMVTRIFEAFVDGPGKVIVL